jgi:hypothetical protein
LLGIPTNTPFTLASLLFSDFGTEGMSPDVKAGTLGFENAEDQMRQIAAMNAFDEPIGPGGAPEPTQPQRPRQVQYPTAAETQAAAPQVVTADAPPVAPPAAVPTARQLQKQDFDRQYDEKRAAALAISDPMARAKALEDVTTFGLQLHKEYFAK